MACIKLPRRMLLAVLCAWVLAGCNPTQRFVFRASMPGTWAQLNSLALLPIDWTQSHVDGAAYTEFQSLLEPQRRVALEQDIANASEVLVNQVVTRSSYLPIHVGDGMPHLRLIVLRWERGYWNYFGNHPTILRVRVVLERAEGSMDDVVDLETRYNHPITSPNPAAGVRNAAEQIATELLAWLRERTGR